MLYVTLPSFYSILPSADKQIQLKNNIAHPRTKKGAAFMALGGILIFKKKETLCLNASEY